MTTTSDLRLLSAEGLKSKTIAGNNVFLAKTWATWDGSYPILYLHSPSEDMQSLGDAGAPQFTVTATIRVSARVEVRNLPKNGGAAAALVELEVIQQQIKMALINFPPLMKRLQQYPFVRSEIRESGEGDSELAELVMDIGMEFYQGPEDFYPLEEEIPDPVIDPAAEATAVAATGEIVLNRVVIPEYVIVHDGAPMDSTAKNYYVRYRDYIKNVASSEVYSTWPDATLRANILAIMSFTLNRVYTEWYRNKGYDFTITSSTAFDHKWVFGRNIFSNISRIVDEMFVNYLSRPNVRQPILTQYCDGDRVSCPNWMTQWGSKYLGDQGYSAIEILRYFYGNSMYINTAEQVSGVPASWPRVDLQVGSRGNNVRVIQEQLNAIARNYPAIPTVTVDGIFGPATRAAVQKFQSVFNLPDSGVVDYPTWYKISEIYVAVTRIAELYQ